MQAHQLRPAKGSTRPKKRIGRGNASGHGTYSTRGLKGQKARSKVGRFFEGGQTRLMRRLPRRRGFTNRFRVEFAPVNLRDLERFDDGAEVTPEILKEAGILRNLNRPVKVLGTGDITRKLNVTAHRFSMTAKEKIEAAGGTATSLIPDVDREAKRAERAERRAKRSKGKAPARKAEAEAQAEPEKKGKAKAAEEPVEAEETSDGDGE